MNMQQMMKQAQEMQRKLGSAQEELSELEVSGTAGGGMVTVTGMADGSITDIKIDGSALDLDEDDTEMLQDAVLAAINECAARAQEATNARMGAITGGLGMPGLF